MELTLRRQKTLFFPFKFQGPKRRPNHLQIYGHHFLEGTKLGGEGSKQAKPRGPKEGGPRGLCTWPRGPTNLALDALLPSIFSQPTSSWPKTDYKNSPLTFSRTSAAETQKHRKRDLELQIGGGKLRRGAAGVVHLLHRHLHRLHDEEGVVHLWTMGLWK